MVVALFAIVVHDSSTEAVLGSSTSTITLLENKEPLDLSKFENCKVTSTPHPDESQWQTKPIFFPQFPNSIGDDIIKNLVKGVTGLRDGAKAYYAQGKKFRRCKGPNPIAACFLVYPLVDMSPNPDDEKFTSAFYDRAVYFVRSPIYSIPAHHNGKAIKYHGQTGQLDEDEWREWRDHSALGMMRQWKAQVAGWKDLKNYRAPLFVAVERLLDPTRGPAVLQSLTDLFHEAGFLVTDEADVPCIWYQSIGVKELEHHHRYGYEFERYTPGYTVEQRDAIASVLDDMIQTYQNDTELLSILEEYRTGIMTHIRLDHEYVNQTGTDAT